MNYYSYFYLSIYFVSQTVLCNGFTCRYNCKICDPINNGSCLICNNDNWGPSCQYNCNCDDACDINSGNCMIYTNNNNNNSISYTYILLLCVIFIFINVFIYKLIKKKYSNELNKTDIP
jgi:hypothetical protein